MDYPRFVFISPGDNKCQGGTYNHEVVQDATEHKAALEAGYSDSVPDALEAAKSESKTIEAKIDENQIVRKGRKPKEQG